MEDRCDNQPARDYIRVDAIADRCFPRDLVRLAGGVNAYGENFFPIKHC